MASETSDEQARDDTAEAGAIATGEIPTKDVEVGPLGFLKAAKRDFSEGEIASAITIRFLIERVEDLQKETDRLRPFQTKFYEASRDLEVEKGKVSLSKKQEIVAAALLTVGGAGMGISANYFDTNLGSALLAFIVSSLVVVAALYLKASPR